MISPALLQAIGQAGPWITLAVVCLVLLFGALKVIVFDRSLVPREFVDRERERTEKALTYFDRVTTSVDRLTAATTPVVPLLEELSRSMRALREDVDDLREERGGRARRRGA